jgi:AraC family transcriptional activator FtrA
MQCHGKLAKVTIYDQKMPIHRTPSSRHIVAVLVYDELCMFEFSCAAEVFGLPRPEAGSNWYRFKTFSVDSHAVRTQFGGSLVPQTGLAALRTARTILIPGWRGPDAKVPLELARALRAAHARGARLVSICSGVFVLAATGLLDGRRATTHWRYADSLARMYPNICIDPDVLYADEGQILTSAGSAAGLDLCLHLVRRDFDSAMANQVARRLVIPPHREGGQAQFVERPMGHRPQDGLSTLLDSLQGSLDEPHTIATMSAQANMSRRTLMRRFKAATGHTPSQWLLTQRLQLARDLLEQSSLPVEVVAERSGFGSAITLRRYFRSKLRTSPVAYRKRFV